VAIDEVEVYLTPDGYGRVSIVRRSDGLFCIYTHWIMPLENRIGVFAAEAPRNWEEVYASVPDIYNDVPPELGIYGTVDDARRELRSMREFSDATLVPPR
jgi:hypothetical protein